MTQTNFCEGCEFESKFNAACFKYGYNLSHCDKFPHPIYAAKQICGECVHCDHENKCILKSAKNGSPVYVDPNDTACDMVE